VTIISATRTSCRRLLCAAAVLGLLAPGSAADEGQGARRRKTHTVTMDSTSFQPLRLTVGAGDSVVWINKDPFPHTATSAPGGFDSGSIAPDKSWTFKTGKKGEFDYVCTLHPTMKARLTVE
jgi:plastocyanin